MKRDMDLVRDLLLKIEASEDETSLSDLVSEENEREYAAAVYHLRMLIEEVGLVRGINVSSNDGYDWIDLELTWQGHEFLETVRDPETWRKAKEGANKIGSFAIDVLIDVAKAYAKKKMIELGLPI
jgi:hypothetical protein